MGTFKRVKVSPYTPEPDHRSINNKYNEPIILQKKNWWDSWIHGNPIEQGIIVRCSNNDEYSKPSCDGLFISGTDEGDQLCRKCSMLKKMKMIK